MRIYKEMTAVFLSGSFLLAAGEPLVGNGSFEGEKISGIPNWTEKGGFWKGKGTVSATDQEACDGKKSLKMTALEPKSQGQSGSGSFTILPDRKYKVAYSIKRDAPSATGHLIINFSTTDKKNGSFVCLQQPALKEKSLNQWLKVEGQNMQILFFLPKGSSKQYIVLKDGIFSVPSEIFGTEPIKCNAQLYLQGNGSVYFDAVTLEALPEPPAQKKTLMGIDAADKEEAARLMQDTLDKSNRTKTVGKNSTQYKLELPPAFDMTPVAKPDLSQYPASIGNVKFSGARVERDGKPVFLLGAEILSPYLCKMFGIDFWVNSAFGNRVNATKQGNVIKTNLTELPFLEERIREHLRSGVLVWIDLLQDYKIWHSKLLLDHFPELFVSREGFFCWRPENKQAQFLRHATWFNAVEKARKYPVFVYELYNEVCYEDHSPYHYERFRKEMEKKYQDINVANRAWNTKYKSFKNVIPPGSGELKEIVNSISPQLKAEWSLFTEKRFAEIAGDSADWLHKAVPGANVTLQSYNGLPFDFQNNYVNPFFVNPKLNLTAAEFGGTVYAQWEGAENEAEIVSSLRGDVCVGLSVLSSPGKPVIDGECCIGPSIKSASAANTVVDLNGDWQFRAGAVEKKENMKFIGYNQEGFVKDAGLKEGWEKPELNDAQWAKVSVPGMWGKQGFGSCYVGWYRKTFTVPAGNSSLFLSGSELADRGDIYLNGELLHRTVTYSEPFSINITDKVKRDGKNVLAIRIFNRYFHDGYYWGGIRNRILISNVSFQAIPSTPEQIAFFFSLRALQGYSGLCWSYFYLNWMEEWPAAIFNPEKHLPKTLASLPSIKNRINDLGGLIFRKEQQPRQIALTYSLNSARSYLPKNMSLPTERVNDIARSYGGIIFTQRGTDVVSDGVLEDYSKLKQYKGLVLRLNEAVSKEGMANIRRFAEEGGTVIVDRISLTKSAFDGSPVDAAGLLGAKRGKSVAAPLKEIAVDGISGRMKTVTPRHADGGQYAPLELTGAQAFARSGNTIAGAVRKLGKGRIITFTPEISASDFSKLCRKVFEESGIAPELKVTGGSYVEVFTRENDGKYLWSIFNRGKDATLLISGKTVPGTYSVREAFTEKQLTAPSGKKVWSSAELEKGIRIPARNLTALHLVIEPEHAPKLSFTSIPKGQKEALEKFYLPLWDEMKNPKKRVLWYGYTHYAPTILPSAAKVMRDMGIAIDFMASKGFAQELKVIRGGKRILANLNDYDLIVIPRSRSGLNDADCKVIPAYLKQGGNLLLLANHVYDMHSFYTFRMPGILKALGAGVADGAVRDAKNARFGEERRFNTTKILAHEVTRGVRSFASMGATTVSLPGAQCVLTPEASAKTPGGEKALLVLRDDGKSRVAVCGDTEWLSPLGLIQADNAVLWTNLVGWLCKEKPLSESKVRNSVSLPEF